MPNVSAIKAFNVEQERTKSNVNVSRIMLPINKKEKANRWTDRPELDTDRITNNVKRPPFPAASGHSFFFLLTFAVPLCSFPIVRLFVVWELDHLPIEVLESPSLYL